MTKQIFFIGTPLLIFIMGIFLVGGYVMNIVNIFSLDFKAPYKAEILRISGVFIPPVGMIEGYIKIEDN